MANIHDHELDKQIFGHNFEVFPVNDPCTLYIYTLDVFHCMYKTEAAISLLDSTNYFVCQICYSYKIMLAGD